MMTRRMITALSCLCFAAVAHAEPAPNPDRVAAKIDEFLQRHWQEFDVTSAETADDASFLRRVMLDLAGRIPTPSELDDFLADPSADKRRRLVERLINGDEFPRHFGYVLDRMIQGNYAGDQAFLEYLRDGLRGGKAWDVFFREIMLGPWDNDERKRANRFLDKRAKNLETLTTDATRVFFGVDISCAKCHDHPLVEDWKQEHFYGMASFFNRTTGGKGKIGEKDSGEVKFLGSDGNEQTAQMMFLSGQVIDEPNKVKDFSRREQLVNAALEQRAFFSRSFVNRTWQYFFGHGLVEPVDQMHSGNFPAVAGLLPWLADDFAESGYDIRRLVTAIVSTRAYELSSRWTREGDIPLPTSFAVARLRPLGKRPLAVSLLMATGHPVTDEQVAKLVGAIDPREAEFQSSAGEALFMSNNEAVQKLVRAEGENLAARLAKMDSPREIVETAVKTVLTRAPTAEESSRLTAWIERQGDDRKAACEQLVWALVTSAEFRFNH